MKILLLMHTFHELFVLKCLYAGIDGFSQDNGSMLARHLGVYIRDLYEGRYVFSDAIAKMIVRIILHENEKPL